MICPVCCFSIKPNTVSHIPSAVQLTLEDYTRPVLWLRNEIQEDETGWTWSSDWRDKKSIRHFDSETSSMPNIRKDSTKMNLNEEYCEKGRWRGLCPVAGSAVSDVEWLPCIARDAVVQYYPLHLHHESF
jgi:hypothetical protein